eukprot:786013_1
MTQPKFPTTTTLSNNTTTTTNTNKSNTFEFGNDTLIFQNTDFIFDFADKDEELPRVHIRVHQRSYRKRITTIEGLSNDLNFKKILKLAKRTFKTNGAIVQTKEKDRILQFQGDFRNEMKQFLIEFDICQESQII